MSETARVFKIETLGAVDGPGLRLVLFLQGCPLRCPYCHNPEGWATEGGEPVTVEEILARMKRYEGYYRGGGLTLSGGEPLAQADFVNALLARCRGEGIHTALDTSACVTGDAARRAVAAADLLLLDVKSADPALHEECFGFPLRSVLDALALREETGGPVWARHVVAPAIDGDCGGSASRLADMLAPYSCVERVELLPFRKLCLEKYDAPGIPFPLRDAPEPPPEALAAMRGALRERLPKVEIV